MKISVDVAPKATCGDEVALVSLSHSELNAQFTLDLEMSALFDKSIRVPPLGMDLLFIASVVYAIDKMVERKEYAEDCWTRDLSVAIPVRNLSIWEPLADKWSDCISFLTGDRWDISFAEGTRKIEQRNRRKRRKYAEFRGNAVSLLSGGLDSYIGAIDWLDMNRDKSLVFVGHHDRHVKGPMADQTELFKMLKSSFPKRLDLVQMRVGVKEAAPETSFRSRSLIFLAQGVYVAELLGPEVPVIIPENGPIALNVPLSASRRGSCSTRTVHPRFIRGMNEILMAAGFSHPVVNPYAFKTKGEMVKECRVPSLLSATHALTVSCAQSGHNYHWVNRKAGACGRCVPCLFRRAALAVCGLDNQPYGLDVMSDQYVGKQKGDDFRALLAFLTRKNTDENIAQALICNGPVPREELSQSVDLIKRMMAEVRAWIVMKGSANVKKLAGIT